MLEIINDKGEKRFFGSVLNLKKHTKSGIKRAFHKSGQQLKNSFQAEVKFGLKTGHMYGRHQASAPWETPANLTGNYAKSIGFNVSGQELRFGNSAAYAGRLEFGTSRMEPRPGLSNAIQDQERNIVRNFLKEIEREI